jgi:hypothetical protein
MIGVVMACVALAGNPLVPDVGMADPHAHVFQKEDKIFIYATHDYSPNNTGFRMDDWWVWESSDLVNWTKASVLKPPTWDKQAQSCWATDAATRNGSYYWYVSAGARDIAVFTSKKPHGPWADPLGKPLVPKALGKSLNPSTKPRDPGILQDDDGNYYLVFGAGSYYIAKLGEDMVSLAETPRYITVLDPMGNKGPGRLDDKAFLHKVNSTYYLSWGCFYATSINGSPYGPYQYRGVFIDPAVLAPDFRLNNTNTNASAWWLDPNYADRHGSFFVLHGQTYYAVNDRSHSSDVKHAGAYRDSVMAYVHYGTNGSIAPLVINKAGVGQYDASSDIEAENYFAMQSAGAYKTEMTAGETPRTDAARTATRPNGPAVNFVVAGLEHGSVLCYPNIHGIHKASSTKPAALRLTLQLMAQFNGSVHIRHYRPEHTRVAHGGDLQGPLLGECPFSPADGLKVLNHEEVVCEMQSSANYTHGLTMSFHDHDSSTAVRKGLRFDSFQIGL